RRPELNPRGCLRTHWKLLAEDEVQFPYPYGQHEERMPPIFLVSAAKRLCSKASESRLDVPNRSALPAGAGRLPGLEWRSGHTQILNANSHFSVFMTAAAPGSQRG